MPKKTGSKRARVPEGKFLLQVFIDQALHKAFKIECLKRDTTMAKQVESMIRAFVENGEA